MSYLTVVCGPPHHPLKSPSIFSNFVWCFPVYINSCFLFLFTKSLYFQSYSFFSHFDIPRTHTLQSYGFVCTGPHVLAPSPTLLLPPPETSRFNSPFHRLSHPTVFPSPSLYNFACFRQVLRMEISPLHRPPLEGRTRTCTCSSIGRSMHCDSPCCGDSAFFTTHPTCFKYVTCLRHITRLRRRPVPWHCSVSLASLNSPSALRNNDHEMMQWIHKALYTRTPPNKLITWSTYLSRIHLA